MLIELWLADENSIIINGIKIARKVYLDLSKKITKLTTMTL